MYDKLSELDTSPQILEILKGCIQGNISRVKTRCKELEKTITNLKVIGQYNFLNGLIPINLCDMQHRFYTEQGSRKQGKSWGT